MASRHTSGPWNLFEGRTWNHVEQDSTGVSICSLPKTEAGLANARLIASAPELLEALQALIDMSDSEGLICGPRLIDNARAAVAKATGQ
jgi:hypothetical protein